MMEVSNGMSFSHAKKTAVLMAALVGLAIPMSAVAAKKVTLTVLDAWGNGPWYGPMYKEWTEGFEKANPGISLKIIPTGGSTFDKLMAMLVSGTSLDVALGSRPDFAVRGFVQNLRPLHAADPETKNRSYYPGCKDYTTIPLEGKDFMWGMPGNPGTQVLFTNTNLFAKAGIRWDSRASWTPEEFVVQARKLTLDTNGDGKPEQWGATLGWGHISNFIHYVWNNGGDAYEWDSRTGFASKCILDGAGSVEAFKWISELISGHRVVPSGGASFESGKLAMMQNWWFYTSANARITFKWDMMNLPVPAGKTPSYLSNGSGMGSIIKSSKHQSEAWKFLKYVTGDEGDWIRNKYMPHPPILADSAYIPKWREAYPGVDVEVYLKACRLGKLGTWSRLRSNEDRIDALFSQEINKFYSGKVSAQQFCQSMAKSINPLVTQSLRK